MVYTSVMLSAKWNNFVDISIQPSGRVTSLFSTHCDEDPGNDT